MVKGHQEDRMPGSFKNGLVAATRLAEHMCRLITKYRPVMDAAIAAAVSAGAITSAQADSLHTWLDGASAACAVLKAITKY